MTDRDLLQQMIDRIGKQPRAAKFDAKTGRLVELNLAGLDLTEMPSEVCEFALLRRLVMGEWDRRRTLGNQLTGVPPELDQLVNLQELNLSSNQLTNVPPELGQLASVRTLSLSNNQLTSVPPELGQLVNLQELNLSSNQLTNVPPELGQLASVRTLSLSNNQLTSVPPELGQLANLTMLSLESNQLTSVPPELGHLANLQKLYLSSNQLTSVPPELGQLAKLKELRLESNQLTNVPPELGQLASVRALSLSNNQLTSVPPELGQLANLTMLSLESNKLTNVSPELGQLASLHRLSIDKNQLKNVPPELGQLANLTMLSLESNQLTSVPPELGHLANLQTLMLDSNQLPNVPPELGQLASVRTLSLSNNQLTSVPPELGQLASLHRLSIDKNQLKNVPPELGQLASVQTLNLSSNQLTSVPPELGHLANLQKLMLDSNQLTSVPPEVGKLTNLQTLNLGGNQLTSVPPELGKLANLQTLNLYYNQLTSVPPELGQLANLQLLNLDSNQLTSVPPELGQLTSMHILWLDSNQLTNVPPELGQLANLKELKLSSNQLTNIPPELGQLANMQVLSLYGNQLTSVPPEVGKLTNLQGLMLSNNQLTSVPPEVGQLANLQAIWLSNNQLTSVPPEVGQLANLQTLNLSSNQLTSVPPEVGQLANLKELYLHSNQLTSVPHSFAALAALNELTLNDNPLRTPPPEIAALSASAVCAYLARLDDMSVLRREAKLLLIGEGRTGKTSMLRALRGLPFDAQIDSTHGIGIESLSFTPPDSSGARLTLHVWDFGGQQIYHTTHQFFMTRRSLYVLVWNAGTDTDQGRLDHWLRNIQVLAPDAPVLLVATHIDQRPADFNLERFRSAYPQIVGFVATSNKSNAGIDELKAITGAEAARLPLMEQEWPRAWVDVEEALLGLEQTHIDGSTFAETCVSHDVSDAYEQQILGGYLHDLGKILYYQDDDVLSDFLVLKPNWLTQATARVLDDEITREHNHGVLDHKDFRRIWHGYERRLYPVFLRMLERFLISYQLEETEPGRHQSLVPLLLPHRPPDNLPPWQTVLPGQPEVRMVFDLDFVPPGIMSWFIVLSHHYSQDLNWREGVRLHYDDHQADVVLNPSTRQLWLQVRGPAPSNFFNILQHTVNDRIIRRYFEGLTYRRRVPCICHKASGAATPCPHYFEYDKLVERKQRGKETIECGESYAEVSVTELLEGIHFSTHDRLEQKLDEMRTTLSAKLDASHALLVENRQLTEQLVRESTRNWNFATRNLFSDAPSVFVLHSGGRSIIDPRNLFSQDFRLQLVCQHPAEPHLVEDEAGYPAPKDRGWWRQMAPWLRQMAKFLKLVPKIGAVAKAYDESWYKTIELNVELFNVAAQTLPDFEERVERMARPAIGRFEGIEMEAEGSALRALHVFLREVDKPQHWCGLERVITNDGNILWLCHEHARFHGI